MGKRLKRHEHICHPQSRIRPGAGAGAVVCAKVKQKDRTIVKIKCLIVSNWEKSLQLPWERGGRPTDQPASQCIHLSCVCMAHGQSIQKFFDRLNYIWPDHTCMYVAHAMQYNLLKLGQCRCWGDVEPVDVGPGDKVTMGWNFFFSSLFRAGERLRDVDVALAMRIEDVCESISVLRMTSRIKYTFSLTHELWRHMVRGLGGLKIWWGVALLLCNRLSSTTTYVTRLWVLAQRF